MIGFCVEAWFGWLAIRLGTLSSWPDQESPRFVSTPDSGGSSEPSWRPTIRRVVPTLQRKLRNPLDRGSRTRAPHRVEDRERSTRGATVPVHVSGSGQSGLGVPGRLAVRGRRLALRAARFDRPHPVGAEVWKPDEACDLRSDLIASRAAWSVEFAATDRGVDPLGSPPFGCVRSIGSVSGCRSSAHRLSRT